MLSCLFRGLQVGRSLKFSSVLPTVSHVASLPLQQSQYNVETSKRTFSSCLKTSTFNVQYTTNNNTICPKTDSRSLLQPQVLSLAAFGQPVRTLVRFSYRKQKLKTTRSVIKRFYRLDWGGWIRGRMGRDKRLWTKGWKRRQKDRRHLIVRAWNAKLFDALTSRFWRTPKHYIDDPYEPYHKRYGIRKTSDMYRNKPLIC